MKYCNQTFTVYKTYNLGKIKQFLEQDVKYHSEENYSSDPKICELTWLHTA